MTAAWLFTAPAPAQPAEALEALTAPWMLPPWVSRDRGTFAMTLLRVVGRELDRLRLQHRRIAAQAWIPSMSFAATAWERQLGLRVRADLSLGLRRARALARKRGLQGPIGAYLQALVMDAVGDTTLPTITVGPGLWAVFRIDRDGWVGDDAFLEAERRLAESGPAAFGNWVLPHARTTGGLLAYQLDWLKAEAWNVARYEDLNGGA